MLAADLLLLALDDERGTVLPAAVVGLDYGLAGAVVMELALRGRIDVDAGHVAARGGATDDALLDDALHAIAARPRRKLQQWVQSLSRDVGGLRQRLLDRLVAQGTLQKREQRVLLLFHREVYPERDAQVEHDIRSRVDDVLLGGRSPDAATACLIHLAAACRILDAIYPHSRRKGIKARVAELDEPGKAGADAVAGAVVQAEAAAVSAAATAAIIASTVAATGAATAAACSAGAGACP